MESFHSAQHTWKEKWEFTFSNEIAWSCYFRFLTLALVQGDEKDLTTWRWPWSLKIQEFFPVIPELFLKRIFWNWMKIRIYTLWKIVLHLHSSMCLAKYWTTWTITIEKNKQFHLQMNYYEIIYELPELPTRETSVLQSEETQVAHNAVLLIGACVMCDATTRSHYLPKIWHEIRFSPSKLTDFHGIHVSMSNPFTKQKTFSAYKGWIESSNFTSSVLNP